MQGARWSTEDRLTILAGFVAPLLLTAVLVPFRTRVANTQVALALLLVVVAVAAFGNRLAGLVAAPSSAIWSDFFLAPPSGRLSIGGRTDIETTVLLALIGVAVTEIAVRGRRQREASSRRAGYLEGIRWTAATCRRSHSRTAATSSCSFRAALCCAGGSS